MPADGPTATHKHSPKFATDALDAVVFALIARAVHLGLTAGPDHLSTRAATEDWIHLPSSRDSLAKLAE